MAMISNIQNGTIDTYCARIVMEAGRPVAVCFDDGTDPDEIVDSVWESTMHRVEIGDSREIADGRQAAAVRIIGAPRVVGTVEVEGDPARVFAVGTGADTEHLCLWTTEEEARQERRSDRQAEAIFEAMVEAGFWTR